jgi:hypothetical protein
MRDHLIRCAHREEPIEEYELLVALDPNCVRVTSLAREPPIVDEDYERIRGAL